MKNVSGESTASGTVSAITRGQRKAPRSVIRKRAVACGFELLTALRAIRDVTTFSDQPKQTRLNDIYDIASAMIGKIEAGHD